jgi:glutathione synthase/RimK-type ligase-like ATP-grasp enzyme
MKLRLLSKQLKSKSLRLLAEELSQRLGYKVWRSANMKPKRIHLLYGDCKDKITQYEWFKANSVPGLPFTKDSTQAKQWLADGKTVVARTLTQSSEGKGIVLLEEGSSFVSAPVYTLYLPKKKEFRVHVFKDQVVSVLEKRRKKGTVGETKIRNTANGYVFCREGVEEPEGIRELALKASKVTHSDFKGVDIGYNVKKNQLFVIEVNSAPGFEGTTVKEYANAITNYHF